MKRGLISLIIALLAFCLTYVLNQTKWLRLVDYGILDSLFDIRDSDDLTRADVNPFVAEETLLMGFDIESLSAIGKWPWKRYVHGQFLDRIQRYSPETVMFDVIFALPESTPPFVIEQLGADSNMQQQVASAFGEMDQSLARALARYDNDYIDLQLMRRSRDADSEAYVNRLIVNEKVIRKHSQPIQWELEDIEKFYSIEPVIEDFVTNANLVAINTQPDPDGVVRTYPLFLPYQFTTEDTTRNVYSITLQILKKYYRVADEDIQLSRDRVVLKNARVPERYANNRQRIQRTRSFADIADKIINAEVPEDYAYNMDLRNFMV
ncbi:MAG: CHASE2 domain-containing protein, partial [Verrucomicrobiota bacterium]